MEAGTSLTTRPSSRYDWENFTSLNQGSVLYVICKCLLDLQVWTKHSGQPAYRKEAKLYLPGKTLEEIEQHEDWHRQLISLQNGKREVHEWDKRCVMQSEWRSA